MSTLSTPGEVPFKVPSFALVEFMIKKRNQIRLRVHKSRR